MTILENSIYIDLESNARDGSKYRLVFPPAQTVKILSYQLYYMVLIRQVIISRIYKLGAGILLFNLV